MMKKNIIFLLAFLAISGAVVIFGSNTATGADLPVVGGGLGTSCNVPNDCSTRLFCAGGICSQCEDNSNCKAGDPCRYGVCQVPAGNSASGPCTKDANCATGLICGVNKTCQYAEEPIQPAKVPAVPTGNTGLNSNDWTGIDITIQDVEGIIVGIACWMMRVAGALMVIFLIWSGILFMYAQGDTTKYKTAKDAFQKTLWGMLVILGVYVIIATVANAVGLENFSFIPLAC